MLRLISVYRHMPPEHVLKGLAGLCGWTQLSHTTCLATCQQQHSAWPAQRHHHHQQHDWHTGQPQRSYQVPAGQERHQQAPPSQPMQHQERGAAVLKLYKGKWILPVRFLVRAKIFQLFGCGSIGLLLGTLTMEEASMADVLALTGLATGMVAASYCLWYYSRRYVGELGLMLPDATRVRFAVLDFWGNREDVVVPLAALKPPFKGVRQKEVDRIASQLLFPVNVEGDRQFYLSIHAGRLLEPQVFISILKGDFNPEECPAVQQAQQAWHDAYQQHAAPLYQQPSPQPPAARHQHDGRQPAAQQASQHTTAPLARGGWQQQQQQQEQHQHEQDHSSIQHRQQQ